MTWDTANIDTRVDLRKWHNWRLRRAGRGAVYCGEPAATIFVVRQVNEAGFLRNVGKSLQGISESRRRTQ